MYVRPCLNPKHALVQESPKNTKIASTIKHPSAMFFVMLPLPVAPGA